MVNNKFQEVVCRCTALPSDLSLIVQDYIFPRRNYFTLVSNLLEEFTFDWDRCSYHHMEDIPRKFLKVDGWKVDEEYLAAIEELESEGHHPYPRNLVNLLAKPNSRHILCYEEIYCASQSLEELAELYGVSLRGKNKVKTKKDFYSKYLPRPRWNKKLGTYQWCFKAFPISNSSPLLLSVAEYTDPNCPIKDMSFQCYEDKLTRKEYNLPFEGCEASDAQAFFSENLEMSWFQFE